MILKEIPKLTGEAYTRSRIGAFVETGGLRGASQCAEELTDTVFIQNVRAKLKRTARPDGQSFPGVSVLSDRYRDGGDPFLI